MKDFNEIYLRAVTRKGGESELLSLLPPIQPAKKVSLQTDDRILSMMSKCIFQAGFSWKVVEQKWPEFEIVFHGFNTKILELLSPDDLDRLAKDTRIIRNMQKIVTVPKNAQWINEIAAENGSFAKFISTWPGENLIGLLQLLKKRGARLGGNTGQRFLRQAGIDGFILTRDVLQALQLEELGIYGAVSSKKDMEIIQSAFNTWHQETKLPYSHISKILAYSVGDNLDNDRIRMQMGL